jgi:hypothetical protein
VFADPDRRRRRVEETTVWRERRAPVREERPIREIIETLVGAAKEAWLNKWRRWIAELISTYNLEDPQEIGYDEAHIEDFLLEHCEDLTEGECYQKIKQMVIEKTVKTVTQDVADTFAAWVEYVKKDPSILCRQYNLPRDVCEEVLKVARNPCIDRGTARRILVKFFEEEIKRLGGEPSEELYRDALNEILRIIPEARCVDWQKVLVAQVTLDRWLRRAVERQRKEEAKKVTEIIPTAKPTPLSEVARKANALMQRITKAKTAEEALNMIIAELRRRGVEIFETPLSASDRQRLEQLRARKQPVAIVVRDPLRFNITIDSFANGILLYMEPEPLCYIEKEMFVRSCSRQVVALVQEDHDYYLYLL